MSKKFKFPDVGEGIKEGVIVKWTVSSGDTVKQDDVLCEIETDKAVVEIPSPYSGKIEKIYHKEGETVPVGEVLVSFSGVDISSESKVKSSLVDKGGVVGKIVDADQLKTEAVGPLFSKLKKKTIDLSRNKVEDKLPVTDYHGEVEHHALAPVRKTIWEHLQKTHDEMISVSQTHYLNVTVLDEYRKIVNEKLDGEGYHFTFLPFIFRALIEVLKTHKRFNAAWSNYFKKLIFKKYLNIGFAVDTEKGLFVPVIHQAQNMDIKQIALRMSDLIRQVGDRSISKNDLSEATFTVTNYGSVGAVTATPIIYYPNTCILGVGAMQKMPRLVKGKLVEEKIMPLTLTYDHRFIDGADAGRFMNDLIKELEDPLRFNHGLIN